MLERLLITHLVHLGIEVLLQLIKKLPCPVSPLTFLIQWGCGHSKDVWPLPLQFHTT